MRCGERILPSCCVHPPGMGIKFSEDVIPLTDLKVNPSRVVKRATDAHRPVLFTRRGRGVAVVQSVNDYESAEEERAFMRALLSEMVIRRITQ